MIRTLDRYVLKRLAFYFFLILFVFVTLFFLIEFVVRVNRALEGNTFLVLQLILYRIPGFVVKILPVTTFISSLVTIADFSSSNELVVVKALGISIYRFSVPFFLFGFLITSSSFTVENFILPNFVKKEKSVYWRLKDKNKPESLVFGKEVWSKVGNKFVNIENLDFSKGEGEKFSLVEVDKKFVPVKRIDALKVKYLSDNKWELLKVFIRDFRDGSLRIMEKDVVGLGIDLAEVKRAMFAPKEMGLIVLLKTMNYMKSLGYNTVSYAMEFYNRFAFPLSSLIFCLLAIPIGMFNPRNQKSFTVLTAFAFVVVVWIIFSLFSTFGNSGALPPFYASFAPVFLFLSVGLFMFSRSHT